MDTYTIFTLSNNIPVLYIPRDQSISSIQVGIKVGSVNETSILHGASHYLEHMLFKGTEKIKDSKEIFNKLYNKGAYINAFTGKENTNFLIKINSKYFELAITILSDMLLHSTLELNEFELEKLVVVEEINQGLDEHSRLLVNMIHKIMFPQSVLEPEIPGTPESILALTRPSVMEYYKKYYCANNLFICITSNLEIDIIKNMLIKSEFPNFPVHKLETVIYNTINQVNPNYSIIDKNLEQIYIAIGFPTCNKFSEDKYVLDFIKILLGGNMNSRLFIDLREKNGLSYQILVNSMYYDSSGLFYIFTSFDKNSLYTLSTIENSTLDSYLQNLFQNSKSEKPGALPLILDNLYRLQTELITDEELNNFKGFIEGNLQLFMEDTENVVGYYSTQLMYFHENILTIQELIDKNNLITKEDIQRVSKKYFDFSKLNISILGNCNKSKLHSYVQKYINYHNQ